MKNLIAVLCLLLPFWSLAQGTQVIYGEVRDNLTQKPIKNVSIELLNYLPLKVAITDENGAFELEDVPLGKHRLLVTHDNYELVIVPDVSVTAGKQVKLNLGMEELVVSMQEIVVQTSTKKTTRDQPNNNMAIMGIRSFNIEDVRRYAGARNDPSRLAANYAGVHIGNDIENGIIVRGNSHLNVLWQLEGMPIPNPNHFSLAGLVSSLWPMINTNLMRNSDFLNGAFPAQYGNVTGAVFDIGLRSGNTNIYEGTIQVGYTGLEAGFEGPISKNKGSSFVISYRYSIYDLIQKIGLTLPTDLIPNNQDLSFKLDFGESKLGNFSIFGLGGSGFFDLAPGDIDSNDIANKFARIVNVRKDLAILGMKYRLFLTPEKKSYWQTTLGGSIEREYYREDTLTEESVRNTVLTNDLENTNVTLSSFINFGFNFNHTLRVGVTETFMYTNSRLQDQLFNQGFRDFQGGTLLSQVYAQYLVRFSKKLRMNLGVNAQHFLLNHSIGVGPRLALSWQPLSSHKFSLGYGWHHQIQPLMLYFNEKENVNGVLQPVNRNLGFTEAHHIVGAYDWAILDNWRLKVEGYYQLYTNIPITTYSSTFSGINMGQELELLYLVDLVNEGFARNYGAEITVEKFFSNEYYGLLTASYMDSKFQGSDGVWRFTPYNRSFVLNFLAGKSFKIGPKRNNFFTIDANFIYTTGPSYTPIDLPQSIRMGFEARQWDLAYTGLGSDYLRADLRIGAQFNNVKHNISHRIFLDMINITSLFGRDNKLQPLYNSATQTVEEASQLGFFPDLTYRMTFGFKPNRQPQ